MVVPPSHGSDVTLTSNKDHSECGYAVGVISALEGEWKSYTSLIGESLGIPTPNLISEIFYKLEDFLIFRFLDTPPLPTLTLAKSPRTFVFRPIANLLFPDCCCPVISPGQWLASFRSRPLS